MNYDRDHLAVDEKVLSLARLRRLYDLKQLPKEFSVGGRIEQTAARTLLCSQQGKLQLPSDLHLKAGDLVVVSAQLEHLSLRGEHFVLSELQKTETVLHTNKAQASEPAFNEQRAKLWAEFLFATRDFFNKRGLLEVTTPYLVQNPGMEPELEPFVSQWKSGSKTKICYLPTSPELHLKQMLVRGFTDIYEIKTAFRNEELTDLHQPEFNMLEWYRGFSNLIAIENDLTAYLEYLSAEVFKKTQTPFTKLERHSVAGVFQAELGFQLTPKTTKEELFRLAMNLELSPSDNFSWNDLFHLIWVAKIEPQLTLNPFLLCDYPPSQAALARINERGWADRFEFYWKACEIANAFHELNDPAEQRKRFIADQIRRVEYGRTPLDIDENFMNALECGMPPSGGIALGLDRLFMAFTGIKKISETRAFTFYC